MTFSRGVRRFIQTGTKLSILLSFLITNCTGVPKGKIGGEVIYTPPTELELYEATEKNDTLLSLQLLNTIPDEYLSYDDKEEKRWELVQKLFMEYEEAYDNKDAKEVIRLHNAIKVLGETPLKSDLETEILYYQYLKSRNYKGATAIAAKALLEQSSGLEESFISELSLVVKESEEGGTPSVEKPAGVVWEELTTGTVTVWVDRGTRLEGGVRYPDRVIGTGFFIDSSGYLITNYHVIESEVDPTYEGYSSLYIRTVNTDERVRAKVIGWDKDRDIALLKTEFPPPYVFRLSDSPEYTIGGRVYAIGSPGGLESTLTSGSISAVGRELLPLASVIQVDLPINPGNSGGPLLNENGEVIGVIFAGIEEFEGINFAVPITYVKELLLRYYEGGKVKNNWLGTVLYESYEVYPEILYSVINSPAAQVGILPGDRIKKINDVSSFEIDELILYIAALPPETLVKVEVERGDEIKEFIVKIGFRPDNPVEMMVEKEGYLPLFPPLFGMKVTPIKGLSRFRVGEVYPNFPADNAGIVTNDTFQLLEWRIEKELGGVLIIFNLKGQKAGYYQDGMVIGTSFERSNIL